MKWNTVKRKISDLKHWESNPRYISEEAFDELTSSIDDLGNFEPLVINTDGTVIAGNQRLRVAKKLGQEEIEVSVPERKLTKKEIKKIGLISNRHSGQWDMDILANEFEDILDELGFDDLLPEPMMEMKEDEYKEEEIEERVKIGEIWELGDHKLMCGDSTRIENVEKLVKEQRIKLIFTSPPYNMGAKMYRNYDDNKKSGEYIQFNIDVIKAWRKKLNGYVFWNISYNKNSRWEFLEIMYRIIKETELRFLELIIWDKTTAIPITSKKQLTRTYEDILVVGDEDNIRNEMEIFGVTTDREEVFFNKRSGRTMTNYWRIKPSNIQIKGLHEACYPIELPFRAMDMVTTEGDIVADPFGGSGSTIIACEQAGRKCYMMELDPHYCDVIIDRWEQYTGEIATKL